MGDGILPSGPPPSSPANNRPDPTVIISKAPVTQAPPASTPQQEGQTLRVQGQVTPDRPAPEGEVRIRTDKGDIVVRSERPIPPDTDVIVDLQRQKAALVATIRIAGKIAEAQSQVTKPETTATTPQPASPVPPPPVVAGDRLTALVLSGNFATSVPAAPPSAAALQAAIQQALQSAQPVKIPLPAALLASFAASSDPEAFMAALPPEQRQILQQAATQTPPPTTQMAGDDSASLDTGLLTLLRAMTTARLTQQAVQTAPSGMGQTAQTAAPSQMQSNLLQALLPILQNLQNAPTTPTLSQQATATPPFQQAPAGIELRIVQMHPAGTSPHTTTPPSPPLLLGNVIGQTESGMAVIRSAQGDIVLNSRVALPVGSQIIFEATPLSFDALAARMATGSGGSALSFDPFSSRTWPALSEALQILSQQAPALAQNVGDSLPTPGPRMVPTTLFFMAALKMGMVESWLGTQTLQTLRDSGGRATADRLSGDFTTMTRQSGEALSGEWRGISLPLLHDAQLSQIQLFTRRQRDEDADGDTQGGQVARFVVNLNLSRIGDMQLDGLMRQTRSAAGQIAKNLDMVIRTDVRLSVSLMQDLQAAYARGLSETGLQGSMQFQAARQGWVNITRTSSDDSHLA